VKPLTQQLRATIMASSGKFASDDFFKLCDALGLERTEAAKQIRALLQDSKIELVGYRQGNSARPLYKVVRAVAKPALKQKAVVNPQPKALQAAKPTKSKVSVDKHYHALKTKERAEKEKHAKQCADRLDLAMRSWR